MIEFASNDNFEQARQIWVDVFGDTEQYARFLFDRLLKPENVLFRFDDDGNPAAMLCHYPFSLVSADRKTRKTKGAYIFGVATLPERRSRGFSTELLAEAERRLFAQGTAATVLVPAGQKLFDFYRKRGYETAFSVRRATWTEADLPNENPACMLRPAKLDSLRKFREEFYSDRELFVDWNESYLRYIDDEARALGGGTFCFDVDSRPGYVVCYPYKNAVIVKELAAEDSSIGKILTALHARYGASEYRLHLPADAAPKTLEPFAMAKWLDPESVSSEPVLKGGKAAYIAHVLDGPTLGAVLSDV